MSYEVQWHGYENNKQVVKKHGIFNTLEEAQDSVREWWKKNDFEPCYIRQCIHEDGTCWWDYGSHICFYYFVPVDDGYTDEDLDEEQREWNLEADDMLED